MSESDGVEGRDGHILNALLKKCLYKQFQLKYIQLTPFFLTTIALSELLGLNTLLPPSLISLSFLQSCSEV